MKLLPLLIILLNLPQLDAALKIENRPDSVAATFVAKLRKGDSEFGTGVVIGHKDNRLYILTANHILEDEGDLNVTLPQQLTTHPKQINRDFKGKIEQQNPRQDLALISIELKGQLKPQFLFIGRSKLHDFDVQEDVKVLGKPQAGPEIRIVKSKLLSKDYNDQPESAEIGGEFIEKGMSGGIVINSNLEMIGLATKIGYRPAGNIARIIKIGTIVDWLEKVKAPANLWKQNLIIGKWEINKASESTKPLLPIKNGGSITFKQDGTVEGLVTGSFAIKNRNTIYFHNIKNGKPVRVPEDNSDVTSRVQLFQTKKITFFSFSGFNFSDNNNQKASRTLMFDCEMENYTTKYKMQLSQITIQD